MMSVQVSEKTFERLQRIAVPLVDSFDTVIARLLDEYEGSEQKYSAGADLHVVKRESAKQAEFSADAPPNLKHSKLLSAEIGGKVIDEMNWNGLLRASLTHAHKAAKSREEFRRMIAVNFTFGRKEDDGFKFLPGLGISVQGQDSIDAWKGALHVARQLQVPLNVTFVWRNKEGAFRPGETGQLKYHP